MTIKIFAGGRELATIQTVRAPRTRAEVTADYRDAKDKRGECRECKLPVKIKSNGKPGKLCADHATADAKRKTKAP